MMGASLQRQYPRQRGAALIVAMLVVALAAGVATRFAFRVQVEDRKLENRAHLAQARWVLRAAEHWALALLRDDARQNSVDHLGELWAKNLPPVDAEGYRISGRVEDMQGRFNVNGIVSNGKPAPTQLAGLTRLLDALQLSPELAPAMTDWLDTDAVAANGRQEPASALNRPLFRVEELRAMPGIDAPTWTALAPFITALPETTPINVNTAPAEVLMAANEGLFPAAAQALVDARKLSWFRDVADFSSRLPHGVNTPLPVSVGSQYFKLRIQATRGRVSAVSEALLTRAQGNAFVWRNAP